MKRESRPTQNPGRSPRPAAAPPGGNGRPNSATTTGHQNRCDSGRPTGHRRPEGATDVPGTRDRPRGPGSLQARTVMRLVNKHLWLTKENFWCEQQNATALSDKSAIKSGWLNKKSKALATLESRDGQSDSHSRLNPTGSAQLAAQLYVGISRIHRTRIRTRMTWKQNTDRRARTASTGPRKTAEQGAASR